MAGAGSVRLRRVRRRIPPAPCLSLAKYHLRETQIDLHNESRLSAAKEGAVELREAQKRGTQMLSTTLQEGLSEYGIGDKIRTLRLKKKMGLVELGSHTGLSPALLSKIERGLMFPTLPTLLRVALVFSVGLEFFFSGGRDKPLVAIVRKKDRVAMPERPGTRDVAYRFESLDFTATERRFNAYLAEFFPVADDALRPHHHPGVEFIHTLHGTLGVHMNGDVHRLAAGDSIYFDANLPHAYRRENGRSCTALVVTAA
jgi:transcriptional regulator with XRE-family HTH domain